MVIIVKAALGFTIINLKGIRVGIMLEHIVNFLFIAIIRICIFFHQASIHQILFGSINQEALFIIFLHVIFVYIIFQIKDTMCAAIDEHFSNGMLP